MDAVSLAGSLAPQDHERQPSGKSGVCTSGESRRSIIDADGPLFDPSTLQADVRQGLTNPFAQWQHPARIRS